ncbi:ash family protein [Ewingella sp. S1.OA.A_B6]
MCIKYRSFCSPMISRNMANYMSMVAQAGLTSVRLVSFSASILTPVWATTRERENSGVAIN